MTPATGKKPAPASAVPAQIAGGSRALAKAMGGESAAAEPRPAAPAFFTEIEVEEVYVPDNDGRLDPQLIESLAASMKSGLINPIRVRKIEKGKKPWEMVAGRRRLAAARLLGWTRIPASVGELTADDAAIEQLNENLQREDLHPLDEAGALCAVMATAGMAIANLAARIGKEERYLRDRMRLMKLAPELAKAFRAGKMSTGQAIALSKLPAADQERARKQGGVFHDRYGFELDLGPEVAQEEVPVTVAETEAWIAANVKLDVSKPDALDLFPATQANLIQAEEKKLKVVEIATLRSYEMDRSRQKGVGSPPLSEENWRRIEKKDCPSAALGIVVLGLGRGESFRICADPKCKVHWKPARQSSAKSSSASPSAAAAEKRRREKDRAEQLKREQLRDRWKKAEPKVAAALAIAISKAPATPKGVGRLLLESMGYIQVPHRKTLAVGSTAESLVRYLAFHQAVRRLYEPELGTRVARSFGIDVKKILDEAAPVKPVAPATTPKRAKKKRTAA